MRKIFKGLDSAPSISAGLASLVKLSKQTEENFSLAKKEIKKLRETLKQESNKSAEIQGRLEEENQELSENLEKLSGDYAEASSENQSLTKFQQDAKKEIQRLQQTIEDLEANLQETQDIMNQKLIETQTHLQDELDYQNSVATREINLQQEGNAAKDRTIAGQSLAIQTQNDTIAEREAEIEKLIEAKAKGEQFLLSKCETEKENLIRDYEKVVSEIRAQCENHRNDYNVLTANFNEFKSKYTNSQSVNQSLKKDKASLLQQLASLKEQYERDRKLSENQIKAKTMALEGSINSKLNEQKAKYETEKQRIYGLVATEFRQYFSPSGPIDDHSYQRLILKVRDDLAKLSKSDSIIRRLVSAGTNVSTDEAVTGFIFGGK